MRSHKTLTIVLLVFLTTVNSSLMAATDTSLVIVFLGDSITYSRIESVHYDDWGNYGDWESYVDYLKLKEIWGSLKIYNEGIPADMVQCFYPGYETQTVEQRVTQHAPEIVMVFMGTNDWKLQNPDYFETVYRYLIQTISEQNPKAQILLCKFSWANVSSRNNSVALDYLSKIQMVANEMNLPIADVWNFTEGHSKYFVKNEIGEFSHLNGVGADAVANYLDSIFRKHLFGGRNLN